MLMRLVLLAAAVLALTACDPIEPTATGHVSLGATVGTAGLATLEMRMFADTAGLGTIAPSSVPAVSRYEYSSSDALGTLGFPHEYGLGGGIGESPYKHWLVVAWLANSAGEMAPSSGEWYGERAVSFSRCMHTREYCGERDGQDFAIDQQAP